MFVSEKKQIFQDFPVIKDYGDNENFFRLQTPAGEVTLPKLLFQKNQPLPDTLSCRIKGYTGKRPLIGHNMPRYVSEFYADGFQRGEEFEFRVIETPHDDSCIYRLEDSNGLQFRLHDNKAMLTVGQTVKCKFEILEQNLFVLRRSSKDTELPMLRLGELMRATRVNGPSADQVEELMRSRRELDTVMDEYDNGYPSWIFSLMKVVRQHLPVWFGEALSKAGYDALHTMLRTYRGVALHLLEQSGFLRNVRGQERSQLQSVLTSQIEMTDSYIRALGLINEKRQKHFIDTMLRNLKDSGYLYHPNSQFSIMMILFRMSPELVNSSLGNIFDTLMGWEPDTWRAEPFRQAFVEQLEIYITDTCAEIDALLQAETPDDNEKIEKVLTAIAIQQSLANKSDAIDLHRHLSVFYRYLSLLRPARAETLLKKSYMTLLGVKLPTDFTWSDIKEPTMMMTRATVDIPANIQLPDQSKYYINGDVEVEQTSEGISIGLSTESASGAVPNGMLPWPALQVNVAMERAMKPSKMKSLDGHNEFWNSIEDRLFSKPEVVVETHTGRRMPDIDDTVKIIVDRVIPAHNDTFRIEAFHCRIVDDHFVEGEGILNANELVGYNLHGVTTGTFRYNDGRPMVLEATVIDIDENDLIKFSLLESTRQLIRDLAYVGDSSLCVITKDNGRSYSAISEKGYGLFLRKEDEGMPPFHRSNIVRASVIGFNGDYVEGQIDEGPIDNMIFDNPGALHNLLLNLAVEDSGQEISDMDLDEEDMLPRETLREIIEILRYKAISKSDDILQSFDYLSFARLLAIAIDDTDLQRTLKAHKDMLMLHQHYAKNKTIYRDDVDRIVALAPDSILIRRLAAKLYIVASLGHSEDNPKLWDVVNTQTNDATKELAQMVLSYNLMHEVNRDDDSLGTIKDKIAKMLNVSSEQRNLKYYGSESQYVEFKSSIVYPARKGKSGISVADPDKQEHEILHIIAGFMNTTGGTLYIGVNDDHYERGLAEDLNFYKLDTSEKNTKYRRSIKSLDNIANYIQVLIDNSFSLGKNAGDYAKVAIDDDSTKGVVMVKVAPCPHIVYLDGELFVRHGSKTEPLTRTEDIDLFVADRHRLYSQQKNADEGAAIVTGTTDDEQTPTMPLPSALKQTSDATATPSSPAPQHKYPLATSAVRKNIVHDFDDYEHFVSPEFYISFVGDNEYIITADEWQADSNDPRLVLTVTNDELDQWLLLVYEDETAVKVPIRELLQKSRDTRHSHYGGRKLVFASPIGADDGLYSLHSNTKDALYERITPAQKIPQGSMSAQPERLLDVNCPATLHYEVINTRKMPDFADLVSTNWKKSQLGVFAKAPDGGKTVAEDVIKDLENKLK